MDNSLRDLLNSSHQRKDKFSLLIALLFLQNISKFLTGLPPSRLSSKLWPVSWHSFGYKKMFLLADTVLLKNSITSIDQYLLRILEYSLYSFSLRIF